MSEGQQQPQFHNYDDGGSSNTLRNVLLGIVAVYIIFSLYFSYSLNTRLNSLEDLEVLKHKGDRNYYEFTLKKSKTPQPVSTVSLLLKKADQKKGKFTLNVIADDKSIEKKDRNMNEPLQFYTGRDRMLYELVVFTIAKDQVSGYISTPKNAPAPLNR